MKKIMFNDKYGLTESVLNGVKTQTRRIVKLPKTFNGKEVHGFYKRTNLKSCNWYASLYDEDGFDIENSYLEPKYKIGEIVSVAQSYENAGYKKSNIQNEDTLIKIYNDEHNELSVSSSAWNNKMFVKSEYMPHHIFITGIRLEKLQDISDEDCISEGIIKGQCGSEHTHFMDAYYIKNDIQPYCTEKIAYSHLIDCIGKKGTWESNPWVWVYEFELIN